MMYKEVYVCVGYLVCLLPSTFQQGRERNVWEFGKLVGEAVISL